MTSNTMVPVPADAASIDAVPSTSPGPDSGEAPIARLRPAVTLALIGGQRLLRDATASLLAAQDGLQVLGTFESAADFLAVGAQDPPAVILLDCDGADPGGWRGAVAAVSSQCGESRIVIVCREIREEVVRCVVERLVSGVILKSYSTTDVRSAICYVATGRTVMPAGWQRAVAPRVNKRLGLSPRHRQILALIAEGRCTDEIAAELKVSPNTVKFHIRCLYSRLGVRNRVEAANQHTQMTSACG